MVKEHNRVARAFAALNPGWNSDKLYHEARRVVVAELQHITYKSWIQALTGKCFCLGVFVTYSYIMYVCILCSLVTTVFYTKDTHTRIFLKCDFRFVF